MLTLSHKALVLVLPISQVWKLQMPYQRKLGICCVFLLGGFVVAVGIVRVVYHYQLTKPNSPIAVDPTCKSRSSLFSVGAMKLWLNFLLQMHGLR